MRELKVCFIQNRACAPGRLAEMKTLRAAKPSLISRWWASCQFWALQNA